MAISKITNAERDEVKIYGLPDKPGLSKEAMQQRFDGLGNLAIDKINEVIDSVNDSEKEVKELSDKVDQFGEGQIPEEYVQSAVETYVNNNQSELATKNNLEELDNRLSSEISNLQTFPFDIHTTLKVPQTNGGYIDVSVLKEAVKSVILYNADSNTDYYISRIRNSTSANRVEVSVTDGIGNSCRYAYNGTVTESGYNEYEMYATEGNLSGKIVIDFSMILDTINLTSSSNYTVTVESTKLAKECVFEHYSILGLQSLDWAKIENKPTDNIAFVIPRHIPVVENHRVNICPNNAIMYADEKAGMLVLSNNDLGGAIEGEVEYAPPTNTSDFALRWRYYEHELLVVKDDSSCVMKIVPESVGNGVTLKYLEIGDSTTQSGTANASNVIQTTLLENFENDVMSIELLGSRGEGLARHEGRGGWTSNDYVNNASHSGVSNPFYNPNTNTFDFSYYMNNMGYDSVDVVGINLGLNDLSDNFTPTQIIANLNTMISSIREYNANIYIMIRYQNVCASWENLRPTAIEGRARKKTILNYLSALKTEFDNDTALSNKIVMCPAYLYVNSYWDMNYAEKALSSRNAKKVFYGTDLTHPALDGYKKIADCEYNSLKYIQFLRE